jgi:hypothetical protein
MTIPLAACSASSNSREPLARQLPEPPAFAQPVETPTPKKGDSAVGVAARERAGRIAANNRIKAFRDWYEGVREDYAK